MLVIPAIDLRENRVVRLFQGDYERTKVYGENPLDYALHFEREGAKRLHIVDLDGAKEGKPLHGELILAMVKKLSIPVQVGGGVRTWEDIKFYLDNGVSQVILGTKALESKEFVKEVTSAFPERVIVSVDIKGNYVATSGWLNVVEVSYLDFLKELNDFSLFAIILTIIERDGTGLGVDLEPLQKALQVSKHPIILAGGVSTLDDLKRLKPYQIFGVITGRALYEGTLNLKEALQIASK
ncbi:MAG: 1-(5-phosphoribosyl)-5-[(5-phosphoribosylamino)methylideneamino]imidazole-4-carboxamide isomerase [Caldimicrobium sp.]|nr:1-(5-phosphoribosyl)-5-[(5-phosphoribosylamino)methylideneamino]imidazole-4-carboxamide isomerase [Caldimicrobium sp.]MCX7613756.1 1-(5-phosphoribosyl)-5-[(5-phosphoribosylamino)methylideneamino]imidazole-4-carboxamide isomerase [Caldimicrobium sp.]MDW8182583.1 1-(5-phosphoribosyl)-5-[(5-phosphoribosylamino)methylideneamino]imidazole-4-carboxamide isomerase [Caldimicrobium sp.]